MKGVPMQILPLALLLLMMPQKGQVFSSSPAFPVGWVEAPAPSQGSVLQCANYSRHEWSVEWSSGINVYDSSVEKRPGKALPPGFVRTKEMKGRTMVQKVADGWLVGFNAGEFGGGLWWSDESGLRTRKLSGENVTAFVPRGDAVLVFTGLAHMSMDEGKLYSFTAKNSGTLVLIADIGSEPAAAMMGNNGTVLIATHIGVLQLTTNNGLALLYGNPAMGLLYPNSIIEDVAGSIVVGMRFYALRLERSAADYKPIWYVPRACSNTRLKRFDCECVGKP